MYHIFLFGGGPLMRRLIDSLKCERNYIIIGLHPRQTEGVDIIEYAKNSKIQIYESENINSKDFINRLILLKIDLIVSCNEKKIFKKELINLPKLGALNIHGGLLPMQRGGGGMYSAFINEQDAGLSVHFITEDIDAGDIIAQKVRKIYKNENILDIIGWVHEVGVDLYIEAIKIVLNKSFKKISQLGFQYTYTPAMPEFDNLINWNEPSKLIHNRIRARQSPIWCFTFYEGKKLFVRESGLLTNVANFIGTNGQVIERNEKGIVVKTGDNALIIKTVAYPDSRAFTPKFKISSMLGINLYKEYFVLKDRITILENAMKIKELNHSAGEIDG